MKNNLLILAGSYAGPTDPGIHTFYFDSASGVLTPAGAIAGIANPAFLVVHPNRRWLYVASETSQTGDGIPGSVWALRCEGEPGGEGPTLQPVNQQPSGGDSPCHLALDATGRWLLISNYSSGTAAVLPILADGSLGEMTDLAQHHGRGPHPERQEGPHAHSAVFAPGNRFAIVADLGIDQLLVYAFDAAAGKLSPHLQVQAQAGAGPRHMALHPNGRRLYVANELDNTVTVYDYDPGAGVLSLAHEKDGQPQTVATLPPGAPENIVAEIQVSPSGRRLYVSNRGHDSIAVFDVSGDRLARTAVAPCGGRWPRHFVLVGSSPGEEDDGRFLLVANQHSDELSVLPLRSGPVPIGPPTARAPMPRPSCVQVITIDNQQSTVNE